MFTYSRYQLVGLPVTHAAGLALWCLLQPASELSDLSWWALWLPVLRVLYDLRTTLIVCAGAAPFLGFALYQCVARTA